MELLVTGSTGFLGRYIVEAALARGHRVRALVRPASDASRFPWAGDERVTIVRGDLRRRDGLEEIVQGVDAVAHAAAAKAGDFYEQFGGTVIATENLLAAMDNAAVKRLVLVGTFSVYDYLRMRSWATLDEDSPIERNPEERDEYARTKLIQERIAREWARRGEARALTVLRPGVIYGPDNLWTARLGAKLSERRWLRIGGFARLPLTFAGNCAEAIVLAAEREDAANATLNVVDDDQPTQRRYVSLLRVHTAPKPRVLPVPWLAMRVLARLAWLTNRLVFRGRAKVPGILIPARLHARCKPLRYDNTRLKRTLGWSPRVGLAEGLERSAAARGHGGLAQAPGLADQSRLTSKMAGESAA